MGIVFGRQEQKLNLFDIPYCRSVKLNFVYISRMNNWCDLPVEHSFRGFCAVEYVIIYIKWLLMYWILCVWFLDWERFLLLTLLCPYLLCDGLLSVWCWGFFGKGCSVCGAWIWLLTISSAVVGLSCAVTLLSPAILCHGWSQASALSYMKQMLDKTMLTLW